MNTIHVCFLLLNLYVAFFFTQHFILFYSISHSCLINSCVNIFAPQIHLYTRYSTRIDLIVNGWKFQHRWIKKIPYEKEKTRTSIHISNTGKTKERIKRAFCKWLNMESVNETILYINSYRIWRKCTGQRFIPVLGIYVLYATTFFVFLVLLCVATHCVICQVQTHLSSCFNDDTFLCLLVICVLFLTLPLDLSHSYVYIV